MDQTAVSRMFLIVFVGCDAIFFFAPEVTTWLNIKPDDYPDQRVAPKPYQTYGGICSQLGHGWAFKRIRSNRRV